MKDIPRNKPHEGRPQRQPLNRRGSPASSDNSAGVKVAAWARSQASDDWRRVLKFVNKDGKSDTVLLEPEDETPSRLINLLKRRGCPLPTSRADQKRLADKILEADPEPRVLLVYRFGWHSTRFLLGAKTIGNGDEPIQLSEMLGAHLARIGSHGTLGEWKDNIAARCISSSYIVFALCVGFAAPLLQLATVESGGFHFWGDSSTGKSTLQSCVATIYGCGDGHDNGYSRSWKTTDAALEEITLGHCDLPLILDELKLLDSDQKRGAQRASDIAYLIASGTGKARSVAHKGSVPSDQKRCRTLLISSGEISLVDNARAGGTDRFRGEEARLIDLPIPDTPTGVFDRLSRGASGEQSREHADLLQRGATAYFGAAGEAFLQGLVNDLADGEAELKGHIERRMSRFFNIAGVDMNDGYEVRFATRFALAYAAGLLAIDYGVVPWKQALVRRCTCRVYHRALRRRTRQTDSIRTVAAQIVRKVLESLVVDIRGTSPAVDPKKAERARVLLVTHSDGSSLHAVRPDFFKSQLAANVSARDIARELERSGLLIPRSKTCRTRQIRIPGLKKRPNYYCLRLPKTASSRKKAKDDLSPILNSKIGLL